jgi:hypothetical protein
MQPVLVAIAAKTASRSNSSPSPTVATPSTGHHSYSQSDDTAQEIPQFTCLIIGDFPDASPRPTSIHWPT